jgi:hypothetical protein
MRVVIASFPASEAAEAYRQSLGDVFDIAGEAVSVGTIAAWGEPYHDHPLVVAWIPRELEVDVRDLAGRNGAMVHEPSLNVVPPRSVALALAARRQREAERRAAAGARAPLES